MSIPIMTRFLRFTQHQAHGTSLLGVIGAGAAGSYAIATEESGKHKIDPAVACVIALAGMATGPLGSKLANSLSGQRLKQLFGVFLFCVAPLVPLKPYLAKRISKRDINQGAETSDTKSAAEYAFLAAIGASTGIIAGIFGVGGGSIINPMLSMSTDLSYPAVLGTSLAAMILPSLFAAAQHVRQGNIVFSAGVPLMFGTATGAYFGGRHIVLNVDEMKLRWGFCGLMVVLGANALMPAGGARALLRKHLKK